MKRSSSFIFLFLSFILFGILLVAATEFIDNNQGDFGNGTFSQTFFNTTIGAVQLNTSAVFLQGNFTSRIFDAGSIITVWNNISWLSNAIGDLPDNNVVETNFENDNADMTGNIILLHQNQVAGNNSPDTSGNDNNATATNMEDGDWVTGIVGNAIDFGGTDEFMDMGAIGDFSDTDSFGYEFWFKTTTSAAQLMLTKQLNSGTFRGYNTFIETGKIKTSLVNTNGVSNRIFKETTLTFNDGTWHHYAMTYDGSSTAAGLIIYIDGTQATTNTLTDALVGTISNAVNLQLSGREGPNVVFVGQIDEVAVFNKTKTALEIGKQYRRAVRKLNMSARSCDDGACSGETFTDYNDTSPQILTEPNNRYFQYRFGYTANVTNATAELFNVTLDVTNSSIVILNVLATPTDTTADITWDTNVNSNSTITFGLTDGLGTTEALDDSLTSHTISLSSLVEATTYFYNVTSCANSICNSTGPFNFTTVPTTFPIITEVVAINIALNSATINWTTNVSSNSSVNFGTTLALGTAFDDASLVTSHTVGLTGLVLETFYFYNVTSCFGLNCNTTGPFNFTTATGLLFSNRFEKPTSPTTFRDNRTYEFFITLSNNATVDTVIIEFDSTNFTTSLVSGQQYTFTIADLEPAAYDFRWMANDSDGNFLITGTFQYRVINEEINVLYFGGFILAFILLVLGYALRRPIFIVLSGSSFIILGITIIREGIANITTPFLTEATSILSLGLGFYLILSVGMDSSLDTEREEFED